jgi:hypothetical protein
MMKGEMMSDTQQESTGDLSSGTTQDCGDGLFAEDEFEEIETIHESDLDWGTESSSGPSGDRSNSTASSSDNSASEDLSSAVPDVSEETIDRIRRNEDALRGLAESDLPAQSLAEGLLAILRQQE